MNAPSLMARLFVAWLALSYGCAVVRGDGGTVRLRQRQGAYDITIFTAPTPIRAGSVDVSVLVQDAVTGEPVPDAQVTIALSAPAGHRHGLRQQATTDSATNKLLRAALFNLPWAGRWDAEVTVSRGAGGASGEETVQFAMEAAERLPQWVTLWPWFAGPAFLVALFLFRRLVVRSPVDSCDPARDNDAGSRCERRLEGLRLPC